METLFVNPSFTTKEYSSKNIINHSSFSFLDIFQDYSRNYYELIKELHEFKLTNLYHYLYIRLIHLHRKFPKIPLLDKQDTLLSSELFNTLLRDYIQDNHYLGLIIMNGIYLFMKPPMNLNNL